MDTLVLEPLNSIESHVSALVTSLTQTNTFAAAPQLSLDLVRDDDNLTTALSLLQRHQENYAHILSLRAEVTSLQDQLKDTIRKCVDFKKEIGGINTAILEDDSEDDEEYEEHQQSRKTVAEVDYHTLLTFAARIGKHNTIAAKEAETEALRRKIAIKGTSTTASQTQNGTQITGDFPTQDTTTLTTGTTTEDSAAERSKTENDTAETAAELARIDHAIAIQRAQMGLSFPDAPTLRLGALGQLQLFRERQEQAILGAVGAVQENSDADRKVQDAMDQEIARMIRETEEIAPEPEPVTKDIDESEEFGMAESPVLGRTSTATAAEAPSTATQPGPAQVQRASRPAQPKKKLDLDFPDSDDEDDE
jgi:hypothetical protein